MKRISKLFLAILVFSAPFHFTHAKTPTTNHAKKAAPAQKLSQKPEKAVKAVKNEKKPHLPPAVIPHEYVVLDSARKAFLLPELSLSQIEEHQRELQKLELTGSNKALEKEAEDLFWSFEIRHAAHVAGTHKKEALDRWVKALNSLHAFKWIYAWTEDTSAALVKVCKTKALKPAAKEPAPRKEKEKQPSKVVVGPSPKPLSKEEEDRAEKCGYIAKKVIDAFPKVALETELLRTEMADSAPPTDSPEKYERLSMPYSEKTEKDEVAFAPVLDDYLNGRNSDLFTHGKEFIEAYPRSMLRYRVMFLMAERYFAKGDKAEAEPLYKNIIEQTPYSYYAIVASERLATPLKDRLKTDPFIDPKDPKLNFLEKNALSRVENLVRGKREEAVAIELEQLTKVRSYPTDLLLYFMKLANEAKQDLSGFRFATEILQRKGEAPLNTHFLDLIFPDRFQKEIEDQATLNKVDPLVVVSLMKQESGFKSGILSSSGAMGLMQLMPFTALDVQKDLKLRTLRDPAKNIEVGTRYLASLLNEKYNGNIVYALAAYNAGPHRVAKWRKDAKPEWGMQEFVEAIPFKETRDYVMSILRNRYWYQQRRGVAPQSVFEAWRLP